MVRPIYFLMVVIVLVIGSVCLEQYAAAWTMPTQQQANQANAELNRVQDSVNQRRNAADSALQNFMNSQDTRPQASDPVARDKALRVEQAKHATIVKQLEQELETAKKKYNRIMWGRE